MFTLSPSTCPVLILAAGGRYAKLLTNLRCLRQDEGYPQSTAVEISKNRQAKKSKHIRLCETHVATCFIDADRCIHSQQKGVG